MPTLVVRSGDGGPPEGAILDGGELVEWLPGDDGGLDDVLLGRVVRIDPTLGAAMVEVGRCAPGWLALREVPDDARHEGARIVVRIRRAGHDGKGPRLTTGIPPAIRAAVDSVAAGLDPPAPLHARRPMERIASAGLAAGCATFVATGRIGALQLRHALGDDGALVSIQPDAWSGVEDQLAAALEPEVALPGGGRLTIERTRALTAIDVDGGPRAALDVDLEAAGAIPREMRLRRIGGIIVVDFVDLPRRTERQRLHRALTGAVASDPEQVEVLAMTGLGLVQMTRRRRGPSLDEMLTTACPSCGGSGRRARAERVG